MATGIMSAAFEATLAFAKFDSRGGAQSLLSRQSVSDILMDVKMSTDAARAMTWAAASAIDNGRGGELALETKIYCSQICVKAVVDAMTAVGVYVPWLTLGLFLTGTGLRTAKALRFRNC